MHRLAWAFLGVSAPNGRGGTSCHINRCRIWVLTQDTVNERNPYWTQLGPDARRFVMNGCFGEKKCAATPPVLLGEPSLSLHPPIKKDEGLILLLKPEQLVNTFSSS